MINKIYSLRIYLDILLPAPEEKDIKEKMTEQFPSGSPVGLDSGAVCFGQYQSLGQLYSIAEFSSTSIQELYAKEEYFEDLLERHLKEREKIHVYPNKM